MLATLPARVNDLSERSVEALFQRYGDDIVVYLRCLIGNNDDAEDLAQDVFIRAIRALRSGGIRNVNPRGWLFTIARNRAFDHLRRQRLAGIFVRTSDHVEQISDRHEPSAIATWNAVDRLPPHWREAVVLRYRWRFTTAEIGQVQGKTEGAVRAELSRSLERLGRDLGKD